MAVSWYWWWYWSRSSRRRHPCTPRSCASFAFVPPCRAEKIIAGCNCQFTDRSASCSSFHCHKIQVQLTGKFSSLLKFNLLLIFQPNIASARTIRPVSVLNVLPALNEKDHIILRSPMVCFFIGFSIFHFCLSGCIIC